MEGWEHGKNGMNMQQNIETRINYKLLLVIILSSLLPTLYTTTRIHFLGSLPETWGFSIAAQIAWLNIFYEVLSEGLLLPLAFIIGQVMSHPKQFSERISVALKVILIAYCIMTTIVCVFAENLTVFMQQSADLINMTVFYIRLESIAILFSSVFAFFSLVLLLKNNQKALYVLLIVKALLMVLFDSLFVSQLSVSLKLGINGVAYTNIIVNLVLGIVAIYWLKKEGLQLRGITFSHQKWLKGWFIIGLRSGLESFVRNAAFVVMILQLVNQVQQAGVFWITNNFIWGWLLLPVLALGQLIKQDAGIHQGLSVQKMNRYFVLTAVFMLLWLTSIPLWDTFIHTVMGIDDSAPIKRLALLMIGFYIVFSFNNVIDSYFYGIGRTDLMLYQSLSVNIIFYGAAYWAYKAGLFIPTLDGIAIMFGLGMTFDAIITLALYLWLRKQQIPQFSYSS